MSETHQRTLRAILTGAAGLLALKNKKLQYEVVNPRFCQFLALGPEEIVGKTDADLFPADQASLSAKEDQAVFEVGIPRKLEQPLAGKEGLAWFEVNRAAILDDDGEAAGILFTAYNITEFKVREQAAQRAEEQVREAQAQTEAAQAEAGSAGEKLAGLQAQLAAAQQAQETAAAQVTQVQQEATAAKESAATLQQQLTALQQEVETTRATMAEQQQAVDAATTARSEAAALAEELLARLRN